MITVVLGAQFGDEGESFFLSFFGLRWNFEEGHKRGTLEEEQGTSKDMPETQLLISYF